MKQRDRRTGIFRSMTAGLLAAVVFLLSMPSAVYADVIWEPPNNFYQNHREDCIYLNRTCTVETDTPLWTSPNSAFRKGDMEAGSKVYISYVYTDADGIQWGLADFEDNWILMPDLQFTYSSEEFQQEHTSEIADGEPFVIEADTEFYTWTYPESGTVSDEPLSFIDDISVTTFYTDPDGREWGYVFYTHGVRDFWICLSDMKAKDIPQREVKDLIPAQELNAEQQAVVEEIRAGGISLIVAVVIPVVLVAALAAFLIWFFWRKKKHKTGVTAL